MALISIIIFNLGGCDEKSINRSRKKNKKN